jgi:hypothetical protein
LDKSIAGAQTGREQPGEGADGFSMRFRKMAGVVGGSSAG